MKHLPDLVHALIIRFFNWSLHTGFIPRRWKQSHIYPIPKPKPFNLDLNNVRPIALLDVFRKGFTKLITERLSRKLSDLKILKGLNFCGLKGEDTSAPIQLINGLFEDALENNKELYFVTQDMKKAYDSVSLESLRLALRRIEVPETLTNWIIELFNKRQMRVITDYGLSPFFMAGDGLDQGDSISPLM